jgi:signal transduction histidine kinase
MSRYDELRVHYTKSPDERMALLDQLMAGPLQEALRLASELGATEADAAAPLFGGRFGELIEILGISAAKLQEVAGQIAEVRARGAASGGLRDEDVHRYRHDLLTPIGTVRGVAGMLSRDDVRQAPELPAGFSARVEGLAAALGELKDVLDALTDARGRDQTP